MAVSRPHHLTRAPEARPSWAEELAAIDAANGPSDASPSGPAPRDLRPPTKLMLAMEGRFALEWVAGLAARPWLDQMEPGDGHTVIVFPGLGASDLSTVSLRSFLSKQGYDAQRWNLGLNLGPREGVLEACRALVRRHAERSGRPVTLIGWSLGGIYARELAKEMPECVRGVITLGTPFSGPPQATNAWRLFEMVSGKRTHEHALSEQLHVAPPVPTTSIYSRTDGVVAWQCSLNVPSSLAENIEVRASHLGMGASPIAQYAIADRLRQDPAAWKPFEAAGGARRWFFKVASSRPAPLQDAA
jgi:pimeloyl-ACP methyl ester carboxylesterase